MIRANILDLLLDLLFFESLHSDQWNEDYSHLLLHFETVILSFYQEQLLEAPAHRYDHLAAHPELLLERLRNLRCRRRHADAVVGCVLVQTDATVSSI